MIGSCLTGGSTVVSLLLLKKNLPKNFVAESFALLNMDNLYLVMFSGWVVLLLLWSRSSSCDLMGFEVMEVVIPSRKGGAGVVCECGVDWYSGG